MKAPAFSPHTHAHTPSAVTEGGREDRSRALSPAAPPVAQGRPRVRLLCCSSGPPASPSCPWPLGSRGWQALPESFDPHATPSTTKLFSMETTMPTEKEVSPPRWAFSLFH